MITTTLTQMRQKFTFIEFKENLVNFLKRIRIPSKVIFIVAGVVSTLWLLFRVIPKPSRATYPCVRAAAPVASSFITYLLGISALTLFFRKARVKLMQSNYFVAFGFIILAFIAGGVALVSNNNPTWAYSFQGPQTGNEPMGIAKGIFPGRVVWVHDPDATDENCANVSGDYWSSDANTDQDVVNNMLSSGLQRLTGTHSDVVAWDSIFHYYNRTHERGNVGYQAGEKITIKINLNAVNNGGNCINTSPQICYSLLDHLINVVGVAQTDISIGDPNCSMNTVTYNKLHNAFPNVTYWGVGGGLTQAAGTAANVFHCSDGSFSGKLPQAHINADYLINIPVLKKHHRAGISLSSKNHFGCLGAYAGGAWGLHPSLPLPNAAEGGDTTSNYQYGIYRCFVDIMGHKDLGGKTILYLMDGIWSSVNWGHPPVKWEMPPFNNDWPSSIFLSQDPVAFESVGYDFLYKEFDADHPTEGGAITSSKGPFPQLKAVDDFLHQCADPANWPSGIDYDPEDDGSILTSMGTHEHWNNYIDKQYSRNLGTGNGIELVKVGSETQFTTENSGLLSEKVTSIYVDSFNVKWFGTDQGLSRYDGIEWTEFTTESTGIPGEGLASNNIRDIAYEKTGYGHEIWLATDSGLAVAGFDIDGVTSATTYTTDICEILSNDVLSVGVDVRHNRWAGTPEGISIYRGSSWYDTTTYLHEDEFWASLTEITITDFGSYDDDSMIFVTTEGAGMLRYKFDPVDGFTGASPYAASWTLLESNNINTISVFGTTQWFGTPEGAFMHEGNSTKVLWVPYLAEEFPLSPNITAIEVDDDGNVWFGSDNGLTIKTAADDWFLYPAGRQASDITFTAGETEVDLSWTNGLGVSSDAGLIDPVVNDIKKDFSGNIWVATDGGVEFFSEVPQDYTRDFEAKRVVFIKEGTTGTLAVQNGTTYTANTEYGGSTAIQGWYCVYNGTGNQVTVTGLEDNTDYRVIVYEYYGEPGSEVYNTEEASDNPVNLTTEEHIEGIDVESELSLNVYPQPFNDYLIIEGNDYSGESIVEFYNLEGKLCYTSIHNGFNTRMNTSAIQKGTYILRIRNNEFNYSTRIIKQ